MSRNVWDEWVGRFPERWLSMDLFQEEGEEASTRPLSRSLLPSNVLELSRENLPTRSFLLLYNDDVIQHDYKGMIEWGIIHHQVSNENMQQVLDVLSQWYYRQEPGVREAFEKELLHQVKEAGASSCWTTLKCIMEKLPDVKHDMIRLDLNDRISDIAEPDVQQFYHETYKNWLMNIYDFEDKDDPSFVFVLVRSFFKSMQMSKHAGNRLGDNQLDTLRLWLFLMDRRYPAFQFTCKEKGDLLFEILQNVKLEPSQLLETSEPYRVEVSEYKLIGESHYEYTHPWRSILEFLSEGAKQKNGIQQYPLHVLLANGLPGQDILLAANKEIADTMCPVEDMYPFLLAARKRNYDTPIAAAVEENETLKSSLDREQLSQTYSLLRSQPKPLIHALQDQDLEFDEAYAAKSKECFLDGERLDRDKAELKKLEKKIAQEEDALAKKRKDFNTMPMYKTKKKKKKKTA